MTGSELKQIVRANHIKQKDLARVIGVSEQALTSYFRTTDVRQETIEKIDSGIKILTNGEKGLFLSGQKTAELTTDPIQQTNIIDTLGNMVKDVEHELADIRLLRVELQQARNDFQSAAHELRGLIAGMRNTKSADLHIIPDKNPPPK